MAHDQEKNIDDVTDEIQRLVLDTNREDFTSDFHGFDSLLPQLLLDIDDAKQGKSPGIPTGFTDYDVLTQGLQPGEMTVIAGRPGMGKSTFVSNIAQHIAFHQDLPVAIFSLEMPARHVAMRIFAAETGLKFGDMRKGELNPEAWDTLNKVGNELLARGATNLLISDNSSLNVQSLRVKREG